MGRKLKVTEMGRMSVEEFKQSDKMPLVVVLDDVRSIYNVGSVFRTADAYRVAAICLCGITARPYDAQTNLPTPQHAEIHKTALGAEDSVEWHYFPTAQEAVRHLKTNGFRVFAVEQAQGSTPLQDLGTTLADGSSQQFAVVLGNEVKGVQQSVVDMCDACLELPQFGTKHSLNVSTTAGIVIWEFAKNLWISKF